MSELIVVIGMLALAVMGLVFPLRRFWRASWEDRTMGCGLACVASIAHGSIYILAAMTHPFILLAYCTLVLGLFLIMPLLERCHYHRRDIRQMEADIAGYQRLIERDPEHSGAYAAMGDAYAERERFDEAIAAYERAIDINPHIHHQEIVKIRRMQYLRQRHERRNRWRRFIWTWFGRMRR